MVPQLTGTPSDRTQSRPLPMVPSLLLLGLQPIRLLIFEWRYAILAFPSWRSHISSAITNPLSLAPLFHTLAWTSNTMRCRITVFGKPSPARFWHSSTLMGRLILRTSSANTVDIPMLGLTSSGFYSGEVFRHLWKRMMTTVSPITMGRHRPKWLRNGVYWDNHGTRVTTKPWAISFISKIRFSSLQWGDQSLK